MNENVVALPRRFPELTAIDQRGKSREARLERAAEQVESLRAQAKEIAKGMDEQAE